MYFVGFYSVSNLILIIFNLLYPVFIVGFDCKSCVLEREKECVKTQVIKARRFLAGISRLHLPRREAYALHMTRMRRASTGWRQLCLASKAFLQDTCKTFCFVLSDTHFQYPHYLYPHYPQMLKSASERKPQPNTLRVRDYHTHISLHTSLWISSTPTSPIPYH